MVCHCLLVESQDGLVLVDTGLGLQDVQGRARRRHRLKLRYMFGAKLDPAETALRAQVRTREAAVTLSEQRARTRRMARPVAAGRRTRPGWQEKEKSGR